MRRGHRRMWGLSGHDDRVLDKRCGPALIVITCWHVVAQGCLPPLPPCSERDVCETALSPQRKMSPGYVCKWPGLAQGVRAGLPSGRGMALHDVRLEQVQLRP